MKTFVNASRIEKDDGDKIVARTKKTKRVPVADQYSNLQTMCRNVVTQLRRKDIEIPETSIELIGNGLPDAKTGAMVINALASSHFF